MDEIMKYNLFHNIFSTPYSDCETVRSMNISVQLPSIAQGTYLSPLIEELHLVFFFSARDYFLLNEQRDVVVVFMHSDYLRLEPQNVK
jgi:hypothetical protein